MFQLGHGRPMSHAQRTAALGRLRLFDPECPDGRFRRVSPFPVRPGEGLLTERTAVVRLRDAECRPMPHSRPRRYRNQADCMRKSD